MKTKSVRITTEQAQRATETYGPCCNLNAVAQRAMNLLLEIEGPVYAAAQREVRQALKKRQDVTRLH